MLFQDSATPIMEGITNLHHDLMFFITFILFFVLVILIRTLFYFKQKSLLIGNNSYTLSRSIVHGTTIEIIWTVIPSLGVKVDACVGRLNQTSLFILRQGVFYGQCSEICGVGHANMPIVVEAVPAHNYIAWLAEKV